MQPPFFSIIVPTHGRDAALLRCLQALNDLNYPPDRCEVIIVYDGGSPAKLPETNNLTINIKTLTQPHSGPAAARNLGAAQAKGDYLAFTDDDCIPTAEWLSHFSAVFQQHPERMVGGQIINALPHNSYAAASQLLVDYLYQQFDDDAQFFASNNLALRRDRFLHLGGFDASFPLAAGEDREFCRRWRSAGRQMHYQPTAIVRHAHNLTLTGFWRQHFNYGRGAYRFRQKTNQSLQRPAFYANLLRYPLQQPNGRHPRRLFRLFLIMQAANTAGFLYQSLISV